MDRSHSVTVRHEGAVSTVTFDAPPHNLLDIDIMDRLVRAHLEADAHPRTQVIVTRSALPQMFCNGLDPDYVVALAPVDRPPVFHAVGRVLHHLFALTKPHISVIAGPAMAGGAILAIPSDFRFFDSDHGRISFTEVKVGLPLPEALCAVIGHFCSPPVLRDVVLGRNLDAREAVAAGLGDGHASGAALEALVTKQVERLTRISPAVLRATKLALRRRLLEQTSAFMHGDPLFESFVGDDFLGEGLRALLEQRRPRFTR